MKEKEGKGMAGKRRGGKGNGGIEEKKNREGKGEEWKEVTNPLSKSWIRRCIGIAQTLGTIINFRSRGRRPSLDSHRVITSTVRHNTVCQVISKSDQYYSVFARRHTDGTKNHILLRGIR